MAALGVELIGHAVRRLSVSGPTSLTGRGYASMQQRQLDRYLVLLRQCDDLSVAGHRRCNGRAEEFDGLPAAIDEGPQNIDKPVACRNRKFTGSHCAHSHPSYLLWAECRSQVTWMCFPSVKWR